MELISKLARMHKTMERDGFVMCAKSNAEKFFLYCKMLGEDITFQLVNNKIRFALK